MALVLVIEDNPMVREIVQHELTAAGHEVRTVPDGPSGIASAGEDRPDAVILDYRMPGMDGRQVLRAIKKLCPDLPVFFHTVYGDFSKPGLTEADAVFVKSADLTPLLDAVARVACRSRYGQAC